MDKELNNVTDNDETQRNKENKSNKEGFFGYRKVKIYDKIKENEVVTSFYLKPINESKLNVHKAGQFISIKPISQGENSDEVRQYSLSMKPGEDFYRISVKREEKGLISRHLHENVNIGDIVNITDPLGEFVLKEGTKHLVLISGGIGVTPVMSMLHKGLEEGREVTFVQAVANSSAHTFKNELKDLNSKNKNIETVVFYKSPLKEDKLGIDYNIEGGFTKEWIEGNLPRNGEFYFCGPLGFMKMIYDTLKSMGIEEDSINYEMFGPSSDLSKI
ncbi:MAG: FAD-binding oxidoreductase [Clostridium sp.]